MARKINKNSLKGTFLTLSAATCLFMVLVNIISIIIGMVNGVANVDTWSIINLAIDVVFYCFIGSQFYKAKINNNYGYALYAVLSLALVEFVIPAIFYLIQGIFTFNLLLPFIIMISSFGVGVAYGIILIFESRNHKKGLIIALMVLGIILGAVGLVNCVQSFYYLITEISNLLTAGYPLSTTETLAYVLLGVGYVISFLFTMIFAIFPFYLNDERKVN